MSNMSYCRFENTSDDLLDCVNAMQEACTLDELDLSEYESSAMKRMRKLCERFLEEYERLQNTDSESDFE